jgi:protein ImuB
VNPPPAPGISAPEPARTIAIWCPDWPVVAAVRAARQPPPGHPAPDGPAARQPPPGHPAARQPPPDSPAAEPEEDEAPIAVIAGNRVVACSQPARAAGVARGMRRREAQGRCPELILLPRDEAAEEIGRAHV